MISKLIDSMEIDHVLDYGCGDLSLANQLRPQRPFKYQAYDADVDRFSDEPSPADMVICLEALSKMPLRKVEDALDELEDLTGHVLFCVINLDKQPLVWWLPKIMDRFSLQRVQVVDGNSACIVAYSLNL